MKELLTKFAAAASGSGSGYGTVTQIDGGGTTDVDLKERIMTIINWVLGIIALVCVIVIIIGGIQYMTSTGDPGKVKKAKDTILYAIIGLIIIILAAAIVNFVIANVTGS